MGGGVGAVLRQLRWDLAVSSNFAAGDFKSRQSKWWTGLEHCHHKNFLMIGQSEVERALLNQLDTPVLYGERVASVQEDEDGVTVATDTGQITHAQFPIGADGSRVDGAPRPWCRL